MAVGEKLRRGSGDEHADHGEGAAGGRHPCALVIVLGQLGADGVIADAAHASGRANAA
jgi:hypothetical protein